MTFLSVGWPGILYFYLFIFFFFCFSKLHHKITCTCALCDNFCFNQLQKKATECRGGMTDDITLTLATVE
jgi:hypothetical protein